MRLLGGPVIHPAVLVPLSGSQNPFPRVDAGAQTTLKLPVLNHNEPTVPRTPRTLSASNVTGRPMEAPFSFTGGAYPGTEGTCGEVIDGGTLCHLDLTFSPPAPGDYEGSVTLDYFDGWDAGRSATFRITGKAR